jgi:uncharacterized repeat protein (TIGR02543 family)
MTARFYPSLSQARGFPSVSQASNTFITFEYGAGFPSLIVEVVPGKKASSPAMPPRTGYTFNGWFLDAGFTRQWDFNSIVGGDNFILYAKWTANTYTITFDRGGRGTLGSATQTVTYDAPYTLPMLSATGYTFGGWWTGANGTGTQYAGGTWALANNLTLYAKWTAIAYYIVYYLNEGVNNPLNPTSYTVEDPDIVLKNPTRENSDFIAWYADAMFETHPIDIIHTQEARGISLYAKFLPKRKIVVAAPEVSGNRYEGDPKLYLTDDGAELNYEAGQPVMETGLENHAYISLFTQEGWCGNAFLPSENNVGSDFEKTCAGSISLSKLADIENSAARALASKAFPKVDAETLNPKSDNLRVKINVNGGGKYSLNREGALWKNQAAKNP